MSNKVKAEKPKAVTLKTDAFFIESSSEYVALGSDGQLYHVPADVEKGQETEGQQPVIDRKGLAMIKRSLPILLNAQKLIDNTEQIKGKLRVLAHKIERGALGSVRFVSSTSEDDEDDNTIGAGVGCTFVPVKELAATLKALGL